MADRPAPVGLDEESIAFLDSDRHKALGLWAGIRGLAAAVGVGQIEQALA